MQQQTSCSFISIENNDTKINAVHHPSYSNITHICIVEETVMGQLNHFTLISQNNCPKFFNHLIIFSDMNSTAHDEFFKVMKVM